MSTFTASYIPTNSSKVELATEQLNNDLDSVWPWSDENRLLLNISKTQAIKIVRNKNHNLDSLINSQIIPFFETGSPYRGWIMPIR